MTRNTPQPLLIFFHNPTPYNPRISLEHYLLHELLYLESTTTLRQASLMHIAL
jgi:hypothetical protein